jgi:hypothetical protein
MKIKNLFFKAAIFFIGSILLLPFSLYSQENITIATYYPSRYGVYNQLVAVSLGVGNNSAPQGLDNLDVPAQPGNVWIAHSVGIGTGTIAPLSTLSVAGSTAIGAAYAGATAAPANGLLVNGDVGVGVTNPNYTNRSDVTAHHINFRPTNNPRYTGEGVIYYDASENALKYYDNTGTARNLGGGRLNFARTLRKTVAVRPNSRPRVTCDNPGGPNDNYVLTGIELYASCNLGHGIYCQIGTQPDVFMITRLRGHCTPIE